ncbi:MAG: Zn-dependent oligopeptidase, partial [Bdellovibrionaceae bacterium]|nr:Zn-dependent oligopeptidase [Pseudobdellovibrionaceae bacterium]
RLISETMRSFKLNGLELADDKLEAFKKLRKEISDLQTQFHANLNNNNDMAVMSETEMEGVPESVRALFTKLPNNQYGISTKATYYVAFMENAVNPEARKKMLTAYENREAKKNTELMQKTISLKRQAAAIIGFQHWADYKTNDKMAKNAKTAWEFLQGLKNKLRKSYNKDYKDLLALKKETNPNATKLDPWDGAYYSNQLRKRKYSLDEEVLREYFPADYVTKKMFEIYETLLNVRFVKVENAITWHPSVNLFEVRDEKTKELLAYFYTDMFPREGKYSHAAAFPLRTGRKVNGVYLAPISSIVANLTPPVPGKPSLLSHEEVDTLFHEFGHIMHMSLTRSHYATLSGSNVAWDFVEAPSQMLENWVWEPQILEMITQKYDRPSESMPKEMIEKLQQSRKFNLGWMNTRQLIFGIFDLTLHQSAKDLDVTETYKKIYKDLTGMDPLPETHFPATFGHIMGGYDAGYYGYLWSNVFAMDMFTKFQGKNLLSKQVGYKYRTSILEKGNTKEASLLLSEFLGRKPNSEAFFRYLGI